MILLLSLAISPSTLATTSATTEYRTIHVQLTYSAFSSGWHYRDLLYYKGIARLLDSYIDDTGYDRKLSPRKLQLDVAPARSAQVILALDRNPYAYRISVRGVLEPTVFVRALRYLALPDWRPFPRNSSFDHMTPLETVLKELDDALGAGEIDLGSVVDPRFVVLHLSQLQVIYQNGALSYELDGMPLAESVQDPIPTRVGDRYLLGTDHGISVYEAGKVLARHGLQRETLPRPFYPIVLNDGKFVDFYAGDKIALIYSSATRSFHPIRRAGPRGWPPGRNSAVCEQTGRWRICAARALERFCFFFESLSEG